MLEWPRCRNTITRSGGIAVPAITTPGAPVGAVGAGAGGGAGSEPQASSRGAHRQARRRLMPGLGPGPGADRHAAPAKSFYRGDRGPTASVLVAALAVHVAVLQLLLGGRADLDHLDREVQG